MLNWSPLAWRPFWKPVPRWRFAAVDNSDRFVCRHRPHGDAWLLSGGTLHLHHGFDPDAFAAQCGTFDDGTVILPAAAITAIAEAGLLTNPRQTFVALWRTPERLAAAKAWEGPSPLVDVTSFGEIGLIAARRGENRLPAPIPHGVVGSSRRPPGAPTVIETTRSEVGTLALRGRMVPVQSFPPAAERGQARALLPTPAMSTPVLPAASTATPARSLSPHPRPG